MVEPVAIVAVSAGVLAIMTSIATALGIILAPAISSPEDKYDNKYDHYVRHSRRPFTPAYMNRGFGDYLQVFADDNPRSP